MKPSESAMNTPDAVLTFWFVTHNEADWFGAKPEFDAELARYFTATHAWVAAGNATAWRVSPDGRLAEIIVLDQFSRQLYRKRPEAFASDPLALMLARELVAGGGDLALEPRRRMFVYLPFMHSEDLADQERCVALSKASGDDDSTKWAIVHRDIIRDFGRFPHRNHALGRINTPDEQAWLDAGGGC